MKLHAGEPYPLGATVDANGVNFALFSANATGVELCVFDADGKRELCRYQLPQKTHQVWHGYLQGAQAGLVYGYRVHGPYQPELGHRFNPHKLLLDPYCRQMVGKWQADDSHFGYVTGSPGDDLSFDSRDNAPFMPKSKVVDLAKLPSPDKAPWRHPISHSIIYELHVKGFTMTHPEVDDSVKGRFAGLATPAVLNYLTELGVNCVELLPIHSFFDEPFLSAKNLNNYWGYNSIGFFAPHPGYLSGDEIGEFRDMVAAFHRAGIEVILDVVYNHTAEGYHLGPTYSFRGIDNASYYRLHPNEPRYYINDSGCGNNLDLTHPRVLQLVMDSLRYWVEYMGVDGFRFDLATCLARETQGFDAGSGFLDSLAQDPVLCRVKLIAEPWDIGPEGYQLGRFPEQFSEWNDKFRDTMRRFWRGDAGMMGEFARRIHGSADVFEHGHRPPAASINFITSHDGFTLRDLVSYSQRHNEANGENNRDGHGENFSYHYGVEGETCDSAINELRQRQCRNLLTTLILSQGVPMLLAGDEMGNSQRGNNNAYCQDGPLGWLDWHNVDTSLQDFTRELISLRQRFPILCHRQFIHHSHGQHDTCLDWFSHDGEPMSKSSWAEAQCRTLSLILSGDLEYLQDGQRQALLLMVNADEVPRDFTLPVLSGLSTWQVLTHTQSTSCTAQSESQYRLQDRSLILLYAEFNNESGVIA